MTPETRPLGLGGAVAPWGAHLLGFFDSPDALDPTALRYLEAGLAAGEQCLWICSGNGRHAEIRRAVRRFGALASRFLETDALILAPFRELYFPHGSALDAAAVTARWQELSMAAADGRYSGLRVFAEVDVRSPDELARVLEYEAHVGESLQRCNIMAACLYPRAAMSAEALRRLRRGHTVLVPITHSSITLLDTMAHAD